MLVFTYFRGGGEAESLPKSASVDNDRPATSASHFHFVTAWKGTTNPGACDVGRPRDSPRAMEAGCPVWELHVQLSRSFTWQSEYFPEGDFEPAIQ